MTTRDQLIAIMAGFELALNQFDRGDATKAVATYRTALAKAKRLSYRLKYQQLINQTIDEHKAQLTQ